MLLLLFLCSFVIAELEKVKDPDPTLPPTPIPDPTPDPIPVVDTKCERYLALARDIADVINEFAKKTDIADDERDLPTATLDLIDYIICSMCPDIDTDKPNPGKKHPNLKLPCKPTDCNCKVEEITPESALLFLQRNDPDVFKVLDIVYEIITEEYKMPRPNEMVDSLKQIERRTMEKIN